jgi:hypothetical protein
MEQQHSATTLHAEETGTDGYLIVARQWPAPWSEDERLAQWSVEHLVRYHGWNEDHVRDGDMIRLETRHGDEHYGDNDLGPPVIPHIHGNGVREAIDQSSYAERVKDVLRGVLDVADPERMWG